MAGILITGMEMLPEGFAYEVKIRGNGDVVDRVTGKIMGKAVNLPEYEDLIERGKLKDALSVLFRNYLPDRQVSEAYRIINQAPTIIPASKE
jgi:hypothetical protein